MGNRERNKLISLWMDFPSKRCGWISIVDLTGMLVNQAIKDKLTKNSSNYTLVTYLSDIE